MPTTGTGTHANPHSGLRIEIARKWTLEEFSSLTRSASDLYTLLALSAIDEETGGIRRLQLPVFAKHPPWLVEYWFYSPWISSDMTRLLRSQDRLYVRQIQFASPGSLDLAGIGSAIGHIKDIFFRFFDFFEKWEERKLENERRKLENEGTQLDNEAKRLENEAKAESIRQMKVETIGKILGPRKTDLTDREWYVLENYVDSRLDPLLRLVESRKVVGAHLLTDEQLSPRKRRRRKPKLSEPGSAGGES